MPLDLISDISYFAIQKRVRILIGRLLWLHVALGWVSWGGYYASGTGK